MAPQGGDGSPRAARLLMRVLMPVVFVSLIDRGLLAFAVSDLSEILHMDIVDYGAIAGTFYLPYALLQFPSLWIANRCGPRRWLALLLVGVGISTALTAFLTSKWQLAAIRMVLGATEAGIFPVMFLTVNALLVEPDVTYVWTWLYSTIQAALIAAGPCADLIYRTLAGFCGVAGWQWLFILNGAVALCCSALVLSRLPDDIETWEALGPEERRLLMSAKAKSKAAETTPAASSHPTAAAATNTSASAAPHQNRDSLLSAFRDWKTAYLSFTQVFAAVPGSAFAYFSPTIIQELLNGANAGHQQPEISSGGRSSVAFLLNAVPYALSCLGIAAVSYTMRATRDRLWHGLISLGAAFLLADLYPAAQAAGSPVGSFACLVAYYASYTLFSVSLDTLPAAYCKRDESPAAVYCLANSAKAVGELLGPALFGYWANKLGTATALAVGAGVTILPTAALFALFFRIAGPAGGGGGVAAASASAKTV